MKTTIIQLIAESANVASFHIQPENTLEEDLGLDSVELLWLQAEIEANIDTSINSDRWNRCRTVRDVVELVNELAMAH